jgi:hypothetical protein
VTTVQIGDGEAARRAMVDAGTVRRGDGRTVEGRDGRWWKPGTERRRNGRRWAKRKRNNWIYTDGKLLVFTILLVSVARFNFLSTSNIYQLSILALGLSVVWKGPGIIGF